MTLIIFVKGIVRKYTNLRSKFEPIINRIAAAFPFAAVLAKDINFIGCVIP